MSIVKEMLKNKDVKEWYDEMLYTGAEITATTYIRRLSAMLVRMGETTTSITRITKGDLFGKMMNYAKEEKENGKAPSYIVSEFKAIYSYLKHRNVDFKRIPNPKNAMSTPTIQNEMIPTQEELAKMLQVAYPRDKVSISLMAFSGVRPAVIGDHHGLTGLKMGDVEGISIEDDIVSIETPLKITISESLSKTSHQYITFLCQEGAEHLKNYLEIRIRDGEKITPASPVVKSVYQIRKFVCTGAIQNGIRESFKKAGINNRPYVLRRYFASKMLTGEYNGIMPHSFSQFMMGHQGEMMDRYTLQKGLLPEQIDNMKEAYHKCAKYLQTDISREEIEATNVRIGKMETKNETLEEMLIDKLNEQKKQQEDLTARIRELEIENQKLTIVKDEAKGENKIIKEELLELVKTVVEIKKGLEKEPEYVEITPENMDELVDTT